jgi:hypothetical protein
MACMRMRKELPKMIPIDYTSFGTHQLAALLEQSKRSERDFQDRLETRLRLGDVRRANHASNSDPVAKRLGFLLAKARNQRRGVEREFAMRLAEIRTDATASPAAGSAVPKNRTDPANASAARRQTWPAVIA